MGVNTVQVNSNIPVSIYPAGQPTALTVVNNDTSDTVWLNDVAAANGFPLSPGSSMSWDVGKPLFAYVLDAVHPAQVTVLDNGGNLFNAAAIASALTESGLSTAIANQIVASNLATNVGTAVNAIPTAAQLYGNGADGTVTISANTTLTRDMQYTTLTVNAGVTLITAGFRVYCSISLTNNGTISNDGSAGSATIIGAGGLRGSLSGGGNGGAIGGQGSPACNGQSVPIVVDYPGGAGGSGNYSSPTGTFYAGLGGISGALMGFGVNKLAPISNALLFGGAGGGMHLNSSFTSTGGGGGGIVFLTAPTFTNNGAIHATGGAGYANGAYSQSGGGGGGITIIVSTTRSGASATSLGGAASGGSSVAGSPGQNIEITL